MKWGCPVCGYPGLEEPPERFSICPSCGTEFGNHDFVFDPRDHPVKLAELRARWLLAGMPWFDEETSKPLDWKPYDQVARLGVGLTIAVVDAQTQLHSFCLEWRSDLQQARPRVASASIARPKEALAHVA